LEGRRRRRNREGMKIQNPNKARDKYTYLEIGTG
jgi:hypothetical protein